MSEQPTRHALALALQAGDARFSLTAADAGEVLRHPKLTRVPNAPAALDGVTSLRGAVLPVFSLSRLLALPDAGRDAKPLVLVLAGGAMGLALDAVSTLGTTDAQTDLLRPLDIEKLARDLLQTGAQSGRTARAPTTAPAAAKQADGVGLLAFELAGQDYALPLMHVDEVMALPQATRLPQAKAGDLGVVHARGALLPLISLRALLGLAPQVADEDMRHVVVARLGAARIGFVVDRLTSVLRAREDALAPVPSILNRGGGEARIAFIYRGADGRLVSVLSPERLFADQAVAEQAKGHQESNPMQTDATGESREQVVVFRLGAEEYGLPISAVDEIARLPETMTRVPRAPSFVKGVMNLRGRVVPLIDQSARFGVDHSASPAARQRVIITHIDDLVAGFIVDEVREILTLATSQIRVAPAVGAEDPRTFDRVAMLEVEDRMILMVDPRELLSRAERDMISHAALAEPDAAGT